MRWEIVRRTDELNALFPTWEALWRGSAARPVTLHPAWVDGWWRSLGAPGGLEGELCTVVVRDANELVGVAPFYLLPPRGGSLRARELRLIGDGLVGVSQAVLARAGDEAQALDLVAEALVAEPGWDLLDVTFSRPTDRVGEAELLGRRFSELGRRVERDLSHGRPEAVLVAPWERFVEIWRPAAYVLAQPADTTLEVPSASEISSRLGELESLCARGGATTAATNGSGSTVALASFRFFQHSLAALVRAEGAMLRLLTSAAGAAGAGPGGALSGASGPPRTATAASVVLIDGERHVELLRVGDATGCDHLATIALRHACTVGARRFEFASGQDTTSSVSSLASEISSGRARGERLRVFRRTTTAVIQRGYASLVRHATQVADAARAPINRLRDVVPEPVTRAVARVATFAVLHLYRGELFVRNGKPPPGTTIRLFSLQDYLALDDKQRFLERLDLAATYSQQKWERGDLVVLAECDGLPAGILWCARGAVFVPDIGREVRPLAGECYIHDVYVTPEARGRAVAPAMLEFLARELRGRDVYRAWALIERANIPSTRAFEKASYASVADVIYARMGLASKLLVRPPDPEARAFLGFGRPRAG